MTGAAWMVRQYKIEQAREALELLRRARRCLLNAEAPKAAERVRMAITSTGGAVRHAELAVYRDERRERRKRGAA